MGLLYYRMCRSSLLEPVPTAVVYGAEPRLPADERIGHRAGYHLMARKTDIGAGFHHVARGFRGPGYIGGGEGRWRQRIAGHIHPEQRHGAAASSADADL